ncbi:MAG TPA: aminoacyl-tRNA hydrolase [Phycisphaerales bacterium]|nr:aminoacyl-tRNA hydrolase [Phycisphaerales bacterium]
MSAKQPQPESFRDDPASPGEVRLGVGVVVPGSVMRFSYASSSGPGGQNVNRRSTKARLRVWVRDLGLRPGAEQRLISRAGALVTSEGELIIVSDSSRSQRANRQACLDRLRELVAWSIVPPKVRRPTRPTRGSTERRLKAKRIQSERKSRRRDGFDG